MIGRAPTLAQFVELAPAVFMAYGVETIFVHADSLGKFVTELARPGSRRSALVDATGVPLSSLAVSEDGRRVASAGARGRVFVWHLGS